jgi:CDP-4-dehydro-6-deoxyglucose reductase, E1
VETAWLCYPLIIRAGAGFDRAQLQEHLDSNGIDTRTIWTGNASRQPFLRGVEYRLPAEGLPNADAIMERGFILPLNHALADEHINFVIDTVDQFLRGH